MNTREVYEELEEKILKPYATLAKDSKGRQVFEEKCNIRTDFQRDRDRIIHSKSFRRLKHKTQVFIAPEGDHYRTRLTHTLEVAQIGRTIARALGLNEDLVEAIGLGHDLGHTPFGHFGEEILDKLNPKGFKHYKQSLRVVDFLESSEKRIGLNLTFEVRDGILNHQGDNKALTLEGTIIKFADRIAYINHDIDDAIRAGIIKKEDLPKDILDVLGYSHSKRINTMISSIIKKSFGKPIVEMEEEIYRATMDLRKFMFDKVYFNPTVKSEDKKITRLLTDLFDYYMNNFDILDKKHLALYESIDHSKEDIITDYIAGMTDTFAVREWKNLFLPKNWSRNEFYNWW